MRRPPEMVDAMTLEEAAFRAWPAAEVTELDGWRLRATNGVTRRANSAWTLRATSNLSLDDRLSRVESFYARRGLPAYFQVAAFSEPAGLDEALASRGYEIDAPVSIRVVSLSQLSFERLSIARNTQTDVENGYAGDWIRLSTDRGRFGAVREHYQGILDRLRGRAGFAVAREGGTAIGIGMGVLDGEWVGIFNMLTVPERRRQGVASMVLLGLTQWAAARGALRAYLQVERASVPALALYASAGFEEAYGYHYRWRRV